MLGEGVRLGAVVVACVVGAYGYREHFVPHIGPLQWIGLFVAGGLLLIAALPSERSSFGTEGPRRRTGRWLLGPASLAILGYAVVLQPRPGLEFETGLAFALAFALFLLFRARPVAWQSMPGLARREPWPAPDWRSGCAGIMAVAVGGAAVVANEGGWHLTAFVGWLVSLSTIFGAAVLWDRRSGESPVGRAESVPARFGLATVLTIGATLRLVQLPDVPALLDADEGRLGAWAELIWAQESFPDLFAAGWNSFPNLAYTVQYAFFPIMERSYLPLRVAAAVVGVLSLWLTYRWVAAWWGSLAGLLAAAFLAANAEHLYWSRAGFNNIQAVAVAAGALWATANVLQRGRWVDFVALGVALGLGFHTYHAAKLHVALLAVPLLFLGLGCPRARKRLLAGSAVSLVAFLLTLGPLPFNIAQDWHRFSTDTGNRTDVHLLIDAYRAGDSARVRSHLYSHVADSLHIFISTPYGLAVFGPVLSVAFILGVIWMLWHWRDPRHLISLVWLFGILIVGSMLTAYPPSKPRLVGLLPVACAVPAVWVAEALVVARRSHAWLSVAATGVAFVMVACAFSYGVHNHFRHLPWLQSADVESAMCRKIRSLPHRSVVYTVGAAPSANPRTALVNCMTRRGDDVAIRNPAVDSDIVPLPPRHDGDAVIFVHHKQSELLPLIRSAYPTAFEEAILAPERRETVMHVFHLASPDLLRLRKLQAEVFAEAGRRWQTLTSEPSVYWPHEGLRIPLGMPSSARVRWRGSVGVEVPGVYGWRVGRGLLRLGPNGRLAEGAEVELYLVPGWYPIEVEVRTAAPEEPVRFDWKTPSEVRWSPVPRENLFVGTNLPSVSVYSTNSEGQESRAGEMRAFAIDWQWATDDSPPEWLTAADHVRFVTEVALPSAGQWLKLDASMPVEVRVGEQRLAYEPAPGLEAPLLSIPHAGRVSIEVRAETRREHDQRPWRLRLLWQEMGGSWTAFAPYRPARSVGASLLPPTVPGNPTDARVR